MADSSKSTSGKPRWWQTRRAWLVALAVLAVVALIFIIVLSNYPYDWTGLGQNTSGIPKDDRPKQLWDWLELLVVPAILAGGVFYLNQAARAREQQAEENRAKVARDDAERREKIDRELAYD